MANKTIIQLPPAATLYPDDVFPIQQLGVVTRHISASQLGITPVAAILALTSAASSNAVSVAHEYTDAQNASISGAIVAQIPLLSGDNSNLEVNDFYGSLNGNWVLNGSEQIAGITDVWSAENNANAFTRTASGNIMGYIAAMPPAGATLAQVAAASGNALVHAKAYTDSEIASLDFSPYALTTSLQTTAGNLQAQIVSKADSSALGSYALTTVAAAMSANAFTQANALTTTASGNIMSYVVALPVGATMAQVASASGNALTQANAFTITASGNLSTAIAGKIDSSALTPYALATSVQTTAGNLVAQINAKADISALANYLPLAGGIATGNISISAANPKLSVIHPGGFTGSMQISGGKLFVRRDSSAHEIVIDGISGQLNGAWAHNGKPIASLDAVSSAESNSIAYTDAASANIMAYIGGSGTVTVGYVQSASANAYVQSNAFTIAASANIMSYVNSITAAPPGSDYVNRSTAQDISGIKNFKADYTIFNGITIGGTVGALSRGNDIGIGCGSFIPLSSTQDYGINNIAIGDKTLYSKSTGTNNTALGANALAATFNPSGNTALGAYSLNVIKGGPANYNSIGSAESYNTAIGAYAMSNVVSGARNIAIGYKAGKLLNDFNNGYYDQLIIDSSSSESLSGSFMWGDMPNNKLYVRNQLVVTASPVSGIRMIDRPTIIAPRERVMALGNVSGAFVIPLSAANYFTLTLTAPATATFIGAPENLVAETVTVMVSQAGQGNNSISWSNTKWAGGTAATLTSGGLDMLNFVTYDGGTTYIGVGSLKDIK